MYYFTCNVVEMGQKKVKLSIKDVTWKKETSYKSSKDRQLFLPSGVQKPEVLEL